MREFRIGDRIGNIATGRHIEIVQLHAVFERHLDVAAIGVGAEFVTVLFTEGNARKHRHAVITLLPVDRVMDVTELLERGARKRSLMTFVSCRHRTSG